MWLVLLWLIQFFCTHSTLLFIDSIYPTLCSNTTALSSAFLSQHRKFVCSHPRKWVFLSVNKLNTKLCSKVFCLNKFCYVKVLSYLY